ncbi:MAG: transcription elongation factor GreA [Alphaproteobacteria bacterium]|nr:transcription elongation factor GreA [Alphaproteobacteria bacterium]MBF0128401.1 transcription elongation factor GreA [Alphaproteobacteria bacterium]
MEKIPMTMPGLATLEDELRRLKMTERPAVIRAIAEAREHGDLSENAEYHAARERQSFIEGRIVELEDIISRAEVIDISRLSGDQVRFGATVTLADEDSDEESTYQIVGVHEADIKRGRISVHSPLGKALIGKHLGDSVEVSTPKGGKAYEIIDVKFSGG